MTGADRTGCELVHMQRSLLTDPALPQWSPQGPLGWTAG